MPLKELEAALSRELDALAGEGRAKAPERVINGYIPAQNGYGPRYHLQGSDTAFLRMNSNSYLSLAHHPKLIEAADRATHQFGVGPGAVRFIDGTYSYHRELEERIAEFTGKPAAKIFNSAYTANCGLALTISSRKTHWIGDQLNHNSIIRAMRIAGVARNNKGIFKHNDMGDLRRCFEEIDDSIDRVIVICDGVYSMRGDIAPLQSIEEIAGSHAGRFREGVVTVVDDSHGIGAYGNSGRGTPEYCKSQPDIIVGTFGKAFGVNGGFIAASQTVIEAVRQKADTYIYTNPLSVADCAAATAAIDLCDGREGRQRLATLGSRQRQFREGLEKRGLESIEGPHPVIPLMVRDTERTKQMVGRLYDAGILTVGLTFPVVPRGDESIRFQINAAHTSADIDYVLSTIEDVI